jgi:hypothetical protein
MEQVLGMWGEAQAHKCVTPSIMMIEATTINLFQNLKGKYPEGVQPFASVGVLYCSVVFLVY